MKEKVLKYSAYSFGYLLLTVLFVYMTFPTEAARDVMERSARYKAGIWTEIGELSLDGLSGVTLDDIFMQIDPKPALGEQHLTDKQRKKEKRPISVNINTLSVEADLLGLASHSPEDSIRYSMNMELFDGTIRIGEHVIPPVKSKKAQDLKKFKIEDIDLRKSRLTRAFLPVELEGILQLEANFRRKSGAPPESGNLTLSIEQALLKSFIAPINDPNLVAMGLNKIQPTDAKLGTIQIEAKIGASKRGRRGKRRGGARGNTILTFERFEIMGGDIEVVQDGEGIIQWTNPSAPLKSGRINLHLGIKVAQAFIDKEVTEKGEVNKPNLMIGMAKNDRSVKQAMRGEWIGIHITGTLDNPTIRKRRPSARVQRPAQQARPPKPKARPAKPKRKSPRPSATPPRSGLQNRDLDAKRKARQDRLQKRREELKKRREERAKERGGASTIPSARPKIRGRAPLGSSPGAGRYNSRKPIREREKAVPEEEDVEPEEEPAPEDYVEEEIDSEDDEEIDSDDDEDEENQDSDEDDEDEEGQTFDEEEEID